MVSPLTRLTSVKKGHAKKAKADPQQILKEFKVVGEHDYEQGASLTVANFSEVSMVDIVSTTKGKGFQGVVKRWNFGGGPLLTDRCFIVVVVHMVCVNGLVVFSKTKRCLVIPAMFKEPRKI